MAIFLAGTRGADGNPTLHFKIILCAFLAEIRLPFPQHLMGHCGNFILTFLLPSTGLNIEPYFQLEAIQWLPYPRT